MPLYKCDKCHCVENTACGYYWLAKKQGEPAACSECNGEGWHGQFKKIHAAGYAVDAAGFLWSKSLVAAGLVPYRVTIVGEVAEDGSVRALSGEGANG